MNVGTRSSSPSSSTKSSSLLGLRKPPAAFARVASSSSSATTATTTASSSSLVTGTAVSPSPLTARATAGDVEHVHDHDLPGNESDSDESLDGLIDRVTGLGIGDKGDNDARSVLRSQLRKGKGRLRDASSFDKNASRTTASTYSERKYYVLSTAGKLIYTNDQAGSTSDDPGAPFAFVGVIQAVISVFLDAGDKIKHIDTGQTRIVFLLRPPLYLVVASDWAEPLHVLRTHLEYLHHLVLALVTQTQLSAVFQRRSNYDLRRLLEGTDSIFASLLGMLSDDLNTSLGTIGIARCEPTKRESVLKALTPKPEQRPKDLLYMMILSASSGTDDDSHSPSLITLIRPRSHSIHPSDLHLLLASIPPSTKAETSFYPFCLPKFNNKGFLYVYASWKDHVGIVVVRSEREVESCRAIDEAVRGRLVERNLPLPIAKPRLTVGELNLPGLRHFVYKHKLVVQLVEAAYEGEYATASSGARKRLMTLYEHMHDALKSCRMSYVQTAHESIYAWSTSTFELYVTASPMLPKRAIVSLARSVSKWVKDHEKELFLLGAPSF